MGKGEDHGAILQNIDFRRVIAGPNITSQNDFSHNNMNRNSITCFTSQLPTRLRTRNNQQFSYHIITYYDYLASQQNLELFLMISQLLTNKSR